jgi:outer membrane protein
MKATISFAVLTIIAIVAISMTCSKSQETVYVNIKEVFDKFEYTIKLKKEFQSITEFKKRKLDSMSFELNVMAEKLVNGDNKDLSAVFEVKKRRFDEERAYYQEQNEAMTESFDNKVLIQLNAYLTEFGKAKGYDYILGTESMGNVIYGKDKYNVTAEAIEFVNKKFNSKSK